MKFKWHAYEQLMDIKNNRKLLGIYGRKIAINDYVLLYPQECGVKAPSIECSANKL